MLQWYKQYEDVILQQLCTCLLLRKGERWHQKVNNFVYRLSIVLTIKLRPKCQKSVCNGGIRSGREDTCLLSFQKQNDKKGDVYPLRSPALFTMQMLKSRCFMYIIQCCVGCSKLQFKCCINYTTEVKNLYFYKNCKICI